MKVFEVISEYSEGDSKEIITERLYVTASDNELRTVADYFTRICYECGKQLMSVREVLTIVQHIENPDTKAGEGEGSVERARAAMGKQRVYCPQGATFDQQARCEQINAAISRCEQINAGISRAIAALQDEFTDK